MKETSFSVVGMTCMGCVNTVANILRRQPGVTSVDVTLEPGVATVTYDDARISPQQLMVAVERVGYQMTERIG
jgi:copper chaperone CopZ